MTVKPRSLADLAAHLREKRHETLQIWRKAVKEDGMLPTAHSLPRSQLNDHIPGLLEAYALRLESGAQTPQEVVAAQNEQAVAHGLHRWQQGYDLQEVSRELGRLNEAVVIQLEEYARERPELEHEVMATARKVWAEMIGVESSNSIAEYFRLQQVEAAGHIEDVEQALEKLRELEQERADLWHQAAHDLRGNMAVVKTAAAVLTKVGDDQLKQERFLRLLDRNVSSLRQLLDDVMDLARLQAGRETRRTSKLDVATSLTTLVDDLQGLAEQRGLFLEGKGPAAFVVEGDAVKVRRLVQNLVINAVKYTEQGGVTLSWGDSASDDVKRWMVSVHDTGPGFAAGPSTRLVAALQQASEMAEQTMGKASDTQATPDGQPSAVPVSAGNVRQEQGEGIGLSIVKRLAELLEATVEVESDATGTTFRVLLPRRYAT